MGLTFLNDKKGHTVKKQYIHLFIMAKAELKCRLRGETWDWVHLFQNLFRDYQLLSEKKDLQFAFFVWQCRFLRSDQGHQKLNNQQRCRLNICCLWELLQTSSRLGLFFGCGKTKRYRIHLFTDILHQICSPSQFNMCNKSNLQQRALCKSQSWSIS